MTPHAPLHITRHDANRQGADFIVGDIHGQYDLLMEGLDRVGFNRATDRLFSVGDLIDRGSRSFDCLSLVFEPWMFAVLGNHEQMALDAFRHVGGRHWEHWLSQGGSWVLAEDAREVQIILAEASKYLPLAREVKTRDGRTLGILHAEPPEDWHQLEVEPQPHFERAIWGRNRIKNVDATPIAHIDAVAVGHTILDAPGMLGNVHYLDTGAFTGQGNLTILPLDALLPPRTVPLGNRVGRFD